MLLTIGGMEESLGVSLLFKHVPQSYRLIPGARYEESPRGTEGNTAHRTLMASQQLQARTEIILARQYYKYGQVKLFWVKGTLRWWYSPTK